jgi:hypothetical protein
MRCKTIYSLVAVILSLGVTAYSQSLADLAKKEKERREQVKTQARVITNSEAAKFKNHAVTTESSVPTVAATKEGTDKDAASEASAKPDSAAKKPANDEPTDFQGRPESFWRQTMSDARKKVKDLENEANVLILRMNDLQNQFYRESSGFRQQDIQREIQKTIFEQDTNKEKLAKAKDALTDLEKEARKSGALPGWLAAK